MLSKIPINLDSVKKEDKDKEILRKKDNQQLVELAKGEEEIKELRK